MDANASRGCSLAWTSRCCKLRPTAASMSPVANAALLHDYCVRGCDALCAPCVMTKGGEQSPVPRMQREPLLLCAVQEGSHLGLGMLGWTPRHSARPLPTFECGLALPRATRPELTWSGPGCCVRVFQILSGSRLPLPCFPLADVCIQPTHGPPNLKLPACDRLPFQ